MSDRPLEAESIAALLEEVAEELVGDPGRRVVVVGGALLALHGLREATRDVDSITAVDAELRDAVARVAMRHGLAPQWLNDHAKPYLPATFQEADCEVLIDRPELTVLGAPLDQVFLMKVFASRAADVDDIEVFVGALHPLRRQSRRLPRSTRRTRTWTSMSSSRTTSGTSSDLRQRRTRSREDPARFREPWSSGGVRH